MTAIIFLDTYILVEISLDNPKFQRFFNAEFVINDLTLAEFYHVLLRNADEKTADLWFDKLSPHSRPVSREILKEAVKFRRQNRKKELSFFDATGYIFALKNGLKFVTGDKEFEHLPNVEFVKK